MGLQPTQGYENSRPPTDLSSRPKRSVVERSAVSLGFREDSFRPRGPAEVF
jgi:hypothetical protein